MKTLGRLLLVVACVAGGLGDARRAAADVKLSALFSDHMVLQRGVRAPVWGWAEPGEKVTVAVGGQTHSATADDKGKWRVTLDPLQTGEPLTLTVRGKNTLTVRDVLVGEVWLGSGQSNMAMNVQRARDFEKEKAAADLPQIRMFTVRSGAARTPQEEVAGSWVVCAPDTVGAFSATAYFFGRELQRELKVPVGLINSSVGGTAVEAWTSMDVQQGNPELKPIFEPWDKAAETYDPAVAQKRYDKQLATWKEAAAKARAEGKAVPRRPQPPVNPREDRNHPATLFNGKIAPLIPYAIRGAIWYQGERNTGANIAGLYGRQLALLIRDWRQRWGQGDFPFAWVQLPNFEAGQRDWPTLREGMRQTLAEPNTGMAIALDVGDPKDIHPTNKQEVGRRLALWARATVYGHKIPYCGPLPAGHTFEGGELTLTFEHVAGGLIMPRGELTGFEVADAGGSWHPAKARIVAYDKVAVTSAGVKKPTAVRYAWSNNPVASLFNRAGLPASPFRTDIAK